MMKANKKKTKKTKATVSRVLLIYQLKYEGRMNESNQSHSRGKRKTK